MCKPGLGSVHAASVHARAGCYIRKVGELLRGDVVAILDGGREGLASQIASVFTNYAATSGSSMMCKTRNPFYVFYSLEGIADSRERIRGICNQMESMHVFSLDGLWLPKRKRIVYEGANNGNVFGPVAGLGLEHKDTWLLSPADRKKVYTSSAKILVGGTVADPPPKPQCQSGEPISWHLTHPSLYTEVLNAFNIKVMVQALAVDHLMAMKHLAWNVRRPESLEQAFFSCDSLQHLRCIERRIPFVGITWNGDHLELLKGKIREELYKAMQDPEHELYEVGLTLARLVFTSLFCLLLSLHALTMHACRTQTQTDRQTDRHRQADAHRKAHTHTHRHTHTHTHARAHARTHARTHARARALTHTHTHHTHTHTCTHTYIPIHTYIHTYIHADMHAYLHTWTHTYTHTHHTQCTLPRGSVFDPTCMLQELFSLGTHVDAQTIRKPATQSLLDQKRSHVARSTR